MGQCQKYLDYHQQASAIYQQMGSPGEIQLNVLLCNDTTIRERALAEEMGNQLIVWILIIGAIIISIGLIIYVDDGERRA